MTSDWCIMSNILKNKICDDFLILCSFRNNLKFEVVITNLHFGKLEHFLQPDTFRKLCILPEKSLWNRKMAECPPSTLFYCSADHVGSETVSMDRYKLMSRMHVPVYLFPDPQDDMFLMYHCVGIYKFIYK